MSQKITYTLDFKANVTDVQGQLNKLKTTLSELATKPLTLGNAITPELREASQAAATLQTHLKKALDPNTGKLDLSRLNLSLKNSGQNAQKLAQSLINGGQQGRQAFMEVSNAVLNAQKSMVKTNTVLQKFANTLMNTARWQLSSSLLTGFTSALSTAVDYTKELNQNLTNIRIVSGGTSKDMERLTNQANQVAKRIGSTTNELVSAQLIYRQQGDSAAEAARKAEITAKAANVSAGTSAEEMSEYLTGIWNSYRVGSQELELYVDKLMAVGAATATSGEEIATSMTKVAATASTVGVTYDQLIATIATVSSATRVSAEQVGTAFKTIYARMGDLQLEGSIDEDGITTTLGEVSGQLAQIGVDIKGTDGQLRDMGSIVEEIGMKWQSMGNNTKTAIAQALGGKRQYTQIFALFENWDEYGRAMSVAANAQGILNKQNEEFMTGIEAAGNKVTAAWENIVNKMIDDDTIVGIIKGFGTFIEVIDWTIDKLGGIGPVLLAIAGIVIGKLAPSISAGLQNITSNFYALTGKAQGEAVKISNAFIQEMQKIKSEADSVTSSVISVFTSMGGAQNTLIENTKKLTAEQREYYQAQLDTLKAQNEMANASFRTDIENAESRQGRNRERLNSDLNANENIVDFLSDNGLSAYDRNALNVKDKVFDPSKIFTDMDNDDAAYQNLRQLTSASMDDIMQSMTEMGNSRGAMDELNRAFGGATNSLREYRNGFVEISSLNSEWISSNEAFSSAFNQLEVDIHSVANRQKEFKISTAEATTELNAEASAAKTTSTSLSDLSEKDLKKLAGASKKAGKARHDKVEEEYLNMSQEDLKKAGIIDKSGKIDKTARNKWIKNRTNEIKKEVEEEYNIRKSGNAKIVAAEDQKNKEIENNDEKSHNRRKADWTEVDNELASMSATDRMTQSASNIMMFASAWTSLSSAVDSWKGVADGSVEIGDALTQSLMSLGIILPGIVSGGKMLAGTVRSMSLGYKNLTTEVIKVTTAEGVKDKVVKLSTKSIWEKVKAQIAEKMTSPIGWAMLAVTALLAVIAAVKAFGLAESEAAKETKRFEAAQKDLEEATAKKEEYQAEVDSLESLSEKLRDAAGDTTKLVSVQKELNEVIGYTPGLITGSTAAYDQAQAKLKFYTDQAKKSLEQAKKDEAAAAKIMLETRKIGEKGKHEASERDFIVSQYTKAVDEGTVKDLTDNKGKFQVDKSTKIAVSDINQYINDSVDSAKLAYQDFYDKIAEEGTNFMGGAAAVDEVITNAIKGGYSEKIDGILTELMNEDFQQKVAAFSEKAIVGEHTEEDLQEVLGLLDEMKKKFPEAAKSWESYEASILSMRVDPNSAAALKNKVKDLDTVNKNLEKEIEAWKTLNDLIATYNTYGKITSEQFEKLLQMHPKFLDFLKDENGILSLNTDLIGERQASYYKEQITSRLFDGSNSILTQLSQTGGIDEQLKFWDMEQRKYFNKEESIKLIVSHIGSMIATDKDFANNIDKYQQLAEEIANYYNNMQQWRAQSILLEAERELKTAQKSVRDAEKALKDFYDKESLAKLEHGLSKRQAIIDKYSDKISNIDFTKEFANAEDGKVAIDLVSKKLTLIKQQRNALQQEFNRLSSLTPSSAEEAEKIASTMRTLYDSIKDSVQTLKETELELLELPYNTLISLYEKQNEVLNGQYETYEKIKQAVIDDEYNSFSDYSVGIALAQSLVYDDTSEERLEEIEEENAKILDEMDKHLEEVADLEDKAREEKRKKDEEERAREKQDLLDRKKEADELLSKATNNMAIAKKSYASFAVDTIEITDNLVQALKLKIDEGFSTDAAGINKKRKEDAVAASGGLLTLDDPRGYFSTSENHYVLHWYDEKNGKEVSEKFGGKEVIGYTSGKNSFGLGRALDKKGQAKYGYEIATIYNNYKNLNASKSGDIVTFQYRPDPNDEWTTRAAWITKEKISQDFKNKSLYPYFTKDITYDEYKEDIVNALIEEILGAAGGGNESGLIGYIKNKVKDYQGSKPTGSIPSAISSGLPLKDMPTPSSYFGPRIHPIQGIRKNHTGIDLAVVQGTPVYATEAGEVIMSSWNGGYGNCIMIDHGNGVVTLYGHNSKLLVKQGDKVKKGALIAEVGATGNVTGPHLHYEVRYNGDPVNPLNNKYLQLPAYSEGGIINTNDEVLIGEEGQELVYYKGKWFFVDDPTIFKGLDGAKVYSAEDVKNMRQYVSDARTIATTEENKDSTLFNRYKNAWMESLPKIDSTGSALIDGANQIANKLANDITFNDLVPEDLFWAIQDQDSQILSSEKGKNREKLYNLFNKNNKDVEFITNNLSSFQKQHSESISELYHKYSKGELTQEQVLNEKAKADLKLQNDSLWQSGYNLKTLFETKDQLQYILDNELYEPEDYEELIIHIQNIDKLIQTTTENMQTSIEDYNKTQESLVDSIIKPAEDYFEKQDFYSLWDETNDTKIDGWIRVLEEGLSNPDLDEPAKEAIRRAVKEGLDSAVNESLSFLEEQAARVKEPYEAEVKRYQQIYDLTSKHHASINKLEEALHKANLELQQSVLSEKWLDEETRKTVYNTEDYLKQITKIKGIQKEENALYKDYKKQIQKLNDDDVEQAEKLTKEYENQLALKEKELEILNAELDIVKKRNALTTALEEKNVRVFVGGRWTYMSNYQNVQKAAQDLANSEYNLQKARTDLEQKEELLGIDALKSKSQEIIDEIDRMVKETKEDWEDFNYHLEGGAKNLSSFKDAVKEVSNKINLAMDTTEKIIIDKGETYTDRHGVTWSNGGTTFSIPAKVLDDAGVAYNKTGNSWISTNMTNIKNLGGYASGSFSTIGGWAQVNEEGFELYGTKDGQFIELNPGEKIFNNEQFKYLYNISKNKTGLDYLPSSISNSMTVGEVHLTLPNVHDTESFIEGLRNLNSYLKNNNYS